LAVGRSRGFAPAAAVPVVLEVQISLPLTAAPCPLLKNATTMPAWHFAIQHKAEPTPRANKDPQVAWKQKTRWIVPYWTEERGRSFCLCTLALAVRRFGGLANHAAPSQ
jgi:hypothetical protein